MWLCGAKALSLGFSYQSTALLFVANKRCSCRQNIVSCPARASCGVCYAALRARSKQATHYHSSDGSVCCHLLRLKEKSLLTMYPIIALTDDWSHEESVSCRFGVRFTYSRKKEARPNRREVPVTLPFIVFIAGEVFQNLAHYLLYQD